jgi:hypothetical protein
MSINGVVSASWLSYLFTLKVFLKLYLYSLHGPIEPSFCHKTKIKQNPTSSKKMKNIIEEEFEL